MATVYPIIARRCKVRINGVAIVTNEWSIEPAVEQIDVSNFEGSVTGVDVYSFKDFVNGLRGATVNISMWHNVGSAIHDAPLNLQDGAYVGPVLLYLNDLTSPYWNFPVMLVNSVSTSAKVGDIVRCQVKLMNKGAFYYPTGTVS